ncbi:toxin-antitoxin system, antitoxin component [Candidatus Parcubacteria bacterium]|nr:MAG: toxin-antitoxin system, antitoxin component [Candidatus Parcubacteria bacterium]
MPAKNPRINVVLDGPIFQNVRFLAQKEGVSLSTKVRDLLKEALETHEDIYLNKLAENREKSWDDSSALSHEEAWS